MAWAWYVREGGREGKRGGRGGVYVGVWVNLFCSGGGKSPRQDGKEGREIDPPLLLAVLPALSQPFLPPSTLIDHSSPSLPPSLPPPLPPTGPGLAYYKYYLSTLPPSLPPPLTSLPPSVPPSPGPGHQVHPQHLRPGLLQIRPKSPLREAQGIPQGIPQRGQTEGGRALLLPLPLLLPRTVSLSFSLPSFPLPLRSSPLPLALHLAPGRTHHAQLPQSSHQALQPSQHRLPLPPLPLPSHHRPS